MDSQLEVLRYQLKLIERDVRSIAKERGVKVRRHRSSGIDATYPDGTKVHYEGWKHIFSDFIHRYCKAS